MFMGYPIAETLILSLYKWDGITPDKLFVGLRNYSEIFNDPFFIITLGNNVRWAILTLILPVGGGLLLAVALHSGKIYFPTFFRTLFFLSATMSLVTVGLMFALILNPAFGALNEGLKFLGLGILIQDWLGDPKIAIYTLILVFGWYYIGLPMILFYAGISEIPLDLYETATLEGASGWQSLRYITIPLLKPVTIVVTAQAVIQSLKAFDLVMTMTRGGPYNTTSVLGYYMYKQTFWTSHYGIGAATSTVILVLSSVFAILYMRQILGEASGGE
jgi:raffinose/stachyose/melibiose transport system permease protein